jgi:hypothetical protein
MKIPAAEWRQPFYFISENQYLQWFINLAILINTISLALQWYGISAQFSQTLDNINFLFTITFIFELIIKLIGFGWRYFRDPWNIFDIIIVVASLVGVIFSSTNEDNFGP